MTPEQIIKGLEESVKKIEAHYDARNIPIDKRPSENKKALKLIKDLLAENRGLNSAIETLQGIAKDYENHNENLKRENKYLRERLAEEMEHKKDMEGKDECGKDN
jgi:chromosome segregation ATPase